LCQVVRQSQSVSAVSKLYKVAYGLSYLVSYWLTIGPQFTYLQIVSSHVPDQTEQYKLVDGLKIL